MANYLLTYYGGGMPEGQEEQARVMEAWNTWFTSLGDAVVDVGNPTAASRAISPDGSVMDPVSAPTGYTILSAADLDTAVDVAKGCPVLAGGASIVVSEIHPAM